MTSATELVEALSVRLGRQFAVDAGLGAVADVARRLENPSEALDATQQELKARAQALQRAAEEVAKLATATRQLRRILPFTPEGWPDERARLTALAEHDPRAAAESWCSFVLSAAADYRLDALHRLLDDVPLPESCLPLRWRTAACVTGLEQHEWYLVEPMLLWGLDHPGPARSRPPRQKDLQRLRLMLARLALADGKPDLVTDLLEADPDTAASAAGRTMLSRAARLQGDDALAGSLAAEARASAPQDLDVVVDVVAEARQDGLWDRAFEVSREAVDALASLLDVVHDLGRLLTPPAELWVAVAERQIREHALPEAELALQQAEVIKEWDDERLSAVIAQVRASALEDVPRAEALLQSGNSWLAAGEIETARERYETALTIVVPEDHPDLWSALAFRQADCVVVSSGSHPFTLVKPELDRAYERLLAAQQVPGASEREPWSYATEFDLHQALARDVLGPRSDHSWRSVLAAARNLALRPDQARPWSTLADALGLLGCTRLGLELAEHAVEDLGWESSSLIIWLANGAEYDRAAELLQGATDPWSISVLGFVTLRTGSPKEAAGLLSAVPVDPLWTWAREAWLQSLVLLGRHAEAAGHAQDFVADLRGYDDEFDLLIKHSLFARVRGDFDTAVRYGERAAEAEVVEDRGVGRMTLGQALLLAGDPTRGLAELERGIGRRSLQELRDWEDIERPVLERIGAEHGVPLTGLDALEDAIKARRATLEPYDGLAELEHADDTGTYSGTAAQARVLVRVLVSILRGGLDAAEQELAGLDARFDAERSSLLEHLASRRRPAAVLEEVYDGPAEPISPDDVRTLRLGLPASWFEDYDDPATQHPIFLRYLPELRALSEWTIPTVRVYADFALEPDGFTVFEDETVRDGGRLPVNSRACTVEQLEALPYHLRAEAVPHDDGLVWLPISAFGPGDGLATLLTRDTCEIALQHLAQVARPGPETEA